MKPRQNLTERTKIEFSYNDNSIVNSSMNKLETHPISF